MESYKYIEVEEKNHIAHVRLNRPDKLNAFLLDMWGELKQCFNALQQSKNSRVIILSGNGKHFSAGMDVNTLMSVPSHIQDDNEAIRREKLKDFVLYLQSCISAIENCAKPVIASVHGACIGGAVNIITACDIRYCNDQAIFSIRETDLGLVADLGVLQRMPSMVNPGILSELALTGRNFDGQTSQSIGLVTQSFGSREELDNHVLKVAEEIASKSPLVTRGIKKMLLYKRDHTVKDSLDYMASYNSAMLFSNDLTESFSAYVEKRKPQYND